MFTKIFAFCLVLFVSANLASMNEAADHDCPANQTYKECNYICPPRFVPKQDVPAPTVTCSKVTVALGPRTVEYTQFIND
ncbi:uncharacterized protein LOC100679090 isoform X2 [Nasonia vitripennis]|uniref:Uncharacterized protein n=1 Tax=Nasonia vitripennis TaxID=7425 RepID=A0A7M7PTV2_NASVI|nr:uncharacterized protein LOC100679090 isoform X2 [Nasonia vitripennis]